MKERPILLSAREVRAIIDGSMMQIRQVVKGQALKFLESGERPSDFGGATDSKALCPYGQPGDRLLVYKPRWASRVTLEITGLRVERLQDITNNDALDEGTPDLRTIENGWDMRRCFQDLWEQINGVGSWGENPWVWVIEFKKV